MMSLEIRGTGTDVTIETALNLGRAPVEHFCARIVHVALISLHVP
jgi:hypothetical protein